jgi:hypothetical protein
MPPYPPGLILFHGKYDFKLGRAADIGPLGELLNRSYPRELWPALYAVLILFQRFRNSGDSLRISFGAIG